MSQTEGEPISLVIIGVISRRSVQNMMRIFWVSRIYTQNGPQNILIWTWKAKATCRIIFCDCQSNDKNIYAKFHEKIFNDSQDIKKNT